MTRKYNIITAIAIAVVVAIGAVVFYQQCFIQEPEAEAEQKAAEKELEAKDIPVVVWYELGYGSEAAYNADLAAKKEQAAGMSDEVIEKYVDVIDEEQINILHELEKKMGDSWDMVEYNSYLDEFNDIVANCEEKLNQLIEEQEAREAYEEAANYQYNDYQTVGGYYESNGSGLTRSGGVNWHNGRKETWYSSNTLYHYRTGEWTVDNEGFYRDSNGYYVVATSDMAPGTVFEGSKGTCISLDSGCNAGVTDYYVNF